MGNIRNSYKVFNVEPPGRQRPRWEDNIKKRLKE
jgi:hypothetical protein